VPAPIKPVTDTAGPLVDVGSVKVRMNVCVAGLRLVRLKVPVLLGSGFSENSRLLSA
jgi:hypothetical protein